MRRQCSDGWMLTRPQVYLARVLQRVARLQRQRVRIARTQTQIVTLVEFSKMMLLKTPQPFG